MRKNRSRCTRISPLRPGRSDLESMGWGSSAWRFMHLAILFSSPVVQCHEMVDARRVREYHRSYVAGEPYVISNILQCPQGKHHLISACDLHLVQVLASMFDMCVQLKRATESVCNSMNRASIAWWFEIREIFFKSFLITRIFSISLYADDRLYNRTVPSVSSLMMKNIVPIMSHNPMSCMFLECCEWLVIVWVSTNCKVGSCWIAVEGRRSWQCLWMSHSHYCFIESPTTIHHCIHVLRWRMKQYI